jgi:hypothetical protein
MIWFVRDLGSRLAALARTRSNCTSKLQTQPLVREGARHQETHNCQTEKTVWSWVPDGSPPPRQTSRLTDGHKITWNLKKRSYIAGHIRFQMGVNYWKRCGASVTELVNSLWVKICCGWRTGKICETRGRGKPAFGSRYQRTGAETAEREESVRTPVKCKVWEIGLALELIIITTYECAINPVTNPIPTSL